MIIIKGDRLNLENPARRPEPILFCLIDGTYFYVGSGIIDNELRVLKHWQITKYPDHKHFLVSWSQGTQIPQELGDYLVEINKNE